MQWCVLSVPWRDASPGGTVRHRDGGAAQSFPRARKGFSAIRRQARYRALRCLQTHQTLLSAGGGFHLRSVLHDAPFMRWKRNFASIGVGFWRPAVAEFAAVAPHGMQQNGELSGDTNHGLLVAAPPLDRETPGLERRPALAAHEQPASRFIEHGAHFVVAWREMRPSQSTLVPDWKRFGVRPKYAPTLRDRAKRPGSSIAVRNASAVTGPMPGTPINRRLTGSQTATWTTSVC